MHCADLHFSQIIATLPYCLQGNAHALFLKCSLVMFEAHGQAELMDSKPICRTSLKSEG